MFGNEDSQLCPGQQDADRGNVPSKTIFKQIENIKRVEVYSALFVFFIDLNLLLLNVVGPTYSIS
jgi:hypothetical protein